MKSAVRFCFSKGNSFNFRTSKTLRRSSRLFMRVPSLVLFFILCEEGNGLIVNVHSRFVNFRSRCWYQICSKHCFFSSNTSAISDKSSLLAFYVSGLGKAYRRTFFKILKVLLPAIENKLVKKFYIGLISVLSCGLTVKELIFRTFW